MSGGAFGYAGGKIRDALEWVTDDERVQSRWPKTGQILRKLASVLYDIEHEIDWDVSCDSSIDDDIAFDEQSVAKLRECVSECTVTTREIDRFVIREMPIPMRNPQARLPDPIT
ncbi:MAG: hypothetical protein KDA54_10865 [Phycisphaerales bacterium]|nr:hypothetical protein [Phycisphaerales bacterium]